MTVNKFIVSKYNIAVEVEEEEQDEESASHHRLLACCVLDEDSKIYRGNLFSISHENRVAKRARVRGEARR